MDVHSPRQNGFFYSHLGWIFARVNDKADLTKVADFACSPELMWLHRHELVPHLLLALLSFVVGGWPGLVVGFFLSTVLVYQCDVLHQLPRPRARAQAIRDRRRLS
jgi:stearoyl-CoA desaturase (Delta-9 desaturase)